MFRFFKKKNKKETADKITNEINDSEKKESNKNSAKNSKNTLNYSLTKKQLEIFKTEEAEWLRKENKSNNIVLPTFEGDRDKKNKELIHSLIEYREELKTFKKYENKFYVKSNLEKEIEKVEASLINKFILENNGYFVPYKYKNILLKKSELETMFIDITCAWLFEKYEIYEVRQKLKELGINWSEAVLFPDSFDFISSDKKIISKNKVVYFLDWKNKTYFGNQWEKEDGGSWDSTSNSRHFFYSQDSNKLFAFPIKFISSEIDIVNNTKVIERSSKNSGIFLKYAYPEAWTRNKSFNDHLRRLMTFNFRSQLIKRTEVFLKFEYFKSEQQSHILQDKIANSIAEFDKNKNGKIDLLDENGFNELLSKYKIKIQENGDRYVHDFIKLKRYIDKKRQNIQRLFEIYQKQESTENFEFYFGVFKNEIDLYNKLMFHSMALITHLIDNDKFSFYEIYETFDEINVFNSNWEKNLSERLKNIDNSIEELKEINNKQFNEIIESIYLSTDKLNLAFSNLAATNKISLQEVSKKIDTRLSEINSSVQTGNLLSLITNYQTYKINKNTKPVEISNLQND